MDIEQYIDAIAEVYDFEVKNKDKIVRAKKMMMPEQLWRCPCDRDNGQRYCGSMLCITDTIKDGHCHCNLFHRKDAE